MLVLQLLLLILLFFLVLVTLRAVFSLLSYGWKKQTIAMYISTFTRHIRLMKWLHLTRGKRLVDLWCGDGKALRFFAKTFGLVCEGYEIQPFPYRYGKFLNKLFGYSSIHIHKKDLIQADLRRYDYIYLYLLPHQMAELEPRIFSQVRDDAIVISNSFPFPLHQPYTTLNTPQGKPNIFLYRK